VREKTVEKPQDVHPIKEREKKSEAPAKEPPEILFEE
jgi:hypothetical protein